MRCRGRWISQGERLRPILPLPGLCQCNTLCGHFGSWTRSHHRCALTPIRFCVSLVPPHLESPGNLLQALGIEQAHGLQTLPNVYLCLDVGFDHEGVQIAWRVTPCTSRRRHSVQPGIISVWDMPATEHTTA